MRRRSEGVGWGGFVVVSGTLFLLGIFVGSLTSCGVPAAAPLATDPPTTVTVFVPFPTTLELDAPATVAAVAETVTPRTTVAPFDPVAYVNGLGYGWTDMGPAMEAFRVVAIVRGWSQAAIVRWTPFVFDVIVKESGGCPNTVGGDLFVVGTCDQYTRHGTATDSGAGQVTPVLYHGANSLLCKGEGLCNQWSIISSPWPSFVALVATLEALGRYPYCDYDGAPAYHDCSLIGRTERPLP